MPTTIRSFSAVLLLILVSGCTHLVKISVKPSPLPAVQKLPQTVALVLPPESAKYKYDFHAMGDTWRFPLGTPIQDYARLVAEHNFQQVTIAPSAEKAGTESSADLLLIPRPVKAEMSAGVWAWEKVNFTMVVEWIAKDRATQNTVWLKTITADATETGGNAFTGSKHQQILMQKLFDDLSLKTQAALQESVEIKNMTSLTH